MASGALRLALQGSSMNNHLTRFVLDVKWYFHAAKAEIGIRSSWDPLVQIAMTGGKPSYRAFGTSGKEERRRAAVFRHARIEQALRMMPADQIRLVRLTCEEPLQTLRTPYGDLGNAAHLTEAAGRALRASRSTRGVGDWLDRLSMKYAQGRAANAGLDAIEAIRLGCEELLAEPRESYVRAMGKIPMRRAA